MPTAERVRSQRLPIVSHGSDVPDDGDLLDHFENQVVLGDCVEVMNGLPERSVDLIFADPPYNLQLSGDLRRPNMTLVDAVDDEWDRFDSFVDYDSFTRSWLTACRRVLKETGTLWVIGSYHNIYRVGAAMMDLGYWILNDVVWVKTNPMPQMRGVRFCNAHETLLWVKRSREQQRYTFHYHAMKAANEDKQMRSDWHIPICSGGEREQIDGRKAHSTQKPEALLRRVITSTSSPGDLVLDPFCGSGTTATVAKKLGRRFLTIDREPEYVEVARRRVGNALPGLFPENEVSIDGKRPRNPFVSLVETGRLAPGQQLRMRGADHQAVVNANGTITCAGMTGSIHKVGRELQSLPSCNGWTTWLYTDGDTGAERLIDHLRVAE